MLEHAIRDDLDKHAPRAMCVMNPLKVEIDNIPEGEVILLSLANHPKDEAMGRREVPLTREIFIDRSDFETDPPPGFKRLIADGEVRLRGAYVIKCHHVERDSSGEVVLLRCSADLDTLGKKPEGGKLRGDSLGLCQPG